MSGNDEDCQGPGRQRLAHLFQASCEGIIPESVGWVSMPDKENRHGHILAKAPGKGQQSLQPGVYRVKGHGGEHCHEFFSFHLRGGFGR
jgi:hypothetical protein